MAITSPPRDSGRAGPSVRWPPEQQMPDAFVKDTDARAKSGPAAARYFDLVVVVVAIPVALALGAPAFGVAIGAVAWIAQRVLAQVDRRFISTSLQPRTQLAVNLGEAFGRIWLLVGAIVLAGVLRGRADGLAAAVVVFSAYSAAFVVRVLSGPPPRRSGSAGQTLAEPAVQARPEGGAIGREVAR